MGGGGGARGIFKLLILKKMKLVYLNCPRHTYYSSLPHVIARSHKISFKNRSNKKVVCNFKKVGVAKQNNFVYTHANPCCIASYN